MLSKCHPTVERVLNILYTIYVTVLYVIIFQNCVTNSDSHRLHSYGTNLYWLKHLWRKCNAAWITSTGNILFQCRKVVCFSYTTGHIEAMANASSQNRLFLIHNNLSLALSISAFFTWIIPYLPQAAVQLYRSFLASFSLIVLDLQHNTTLFFLTTVINALPFFSGVVVEVKPENLFGNRNMIPNECLCYSMSVG